MTGSISADYKVPGGKLLRATLTLNESLSPPRIATIALHGDYFMHPEDAIDTLEAQLTGVPWSADALREAVQAFFDSGVEVLGADVAGIVHVILAAR